MSMLSINAILWIAARSIAFVGLGAVTSYAVAIGLSMRAGVRGVGIHSFAADLVAFEHTCEGWSVVNFRRRRSDPSLSDPGVLSAVRVQWAAAIRQEANPAVCVEPLTEEDIEVQFVHSGWPFRSCFGWCTWGRQQSNLSQKSGVPLQSLGEQHSLYVDPKSNPYFPLRIPLGPDWPGLLANSLLFGAVWFGVFVGPGRVRRVIRRRRRCCESCGYDLSGGTGIENCPECGHEKPECAQGDLGLLPALRRSTVAKTESE